jgi:large subunit ribosomal protein L10
MNRQEKELVVSDIRDALSNAQAAFLVDYKGLNVEQLQSLRKELRNASGSLKITKARLMKIAAQDVKGSESFAETFKDQVGLVFAKADVSTVAKKIADFSKENDALKIVSGFFESKLMSKDQVLALASLPSRDVLLAMLARTLNAPATNLTRLLCMLITRLLFVIKQISEKTNE